MKTARVSFIFYTKRKTWIMEFDKTRSKVTKLVDTMRNRALSFTSIKLVLNVF